MVFVHALFKSDHVETVTVDVEGADNKSPLSTSSVPLISLAPTMSQGADTSLSTPMASSVPLISLALTALKLQSTISIIEINNNFFCMSFPHYFFYENIFMYPITNKNYKKLSFLEYIF